MADVAAPELLDLETSQGAARAHVYAAPRARAALVLGHGAGGGVGAPDLVAVTEAALAARISTVLVEQPYRVAGRRSPAPAPKLDAAWTDVVAALRDGTLPDVPLVTGGRSSGARVACRTAADVGAAGVLCLAFPLQPAARAGKPPAPDRLHELEAVPVPVLVVQGERDQFGMPPEGAQRTVTVVAGDHGLKKDVPAVVGAVIAWLEELLGEG